MSRPAALGSVAFALFLSLACNGDPDSIGTSAALADALEDARAGDTIRVEVGTFRGHFVVPAGVTVVGAGADTIIESDDDNAAAVLESGGSDVTTLRSVTVRSSGSAGVLARGTGAACIEDARIEATLGIGVGAQDLASFCMRDVTVMGPLDRDSIDTLPVDPGPTDTATHGVIVLNVTSAELERVTSSGFAKFGVLLIDSGVTWTGGSASDNVGTGMMVYGGSLNATDVDASRTIGAFTLIPPYGAVFTNDAAVETNGLTVSEGDGYGVLHSAAGGVHTDLVVEMNSAAGVWVQSSAGIRMTGAASRVAGNSFAGVVALDSSDITIADAEISGTRETTRVFGEAGRVVVGDGVQLVRSVDAIQLDNLQLDQNERVGILLDLGGDSASGISLTSIVADGTGDQLGVVGQNGTLPPGWDDDVERRGVTMTNDPAFLASGASLDIAGVVAPTDMPAVDELVAGGLDAVGVVAPTD